MRSYHPYRRSLIATHAWKLHLMPKHQEMWIHIRIPISIRCDTCGNNFCRGTNLKFWKEPVVGESYRGIRRFRFCFDCSKCSAKITLKAFPNDANWVLESGATMIREEEAQEISDGIKSLQLDERDDSEDDEGDSEDDEGDSEDDEDLTQPFASYDEAVNNALKTTEFSEEFLDKPKDSSTKATTNWNDRGSSVGSLDRNGRKGSCPNLQN